MYHVCAWCPKRPEEVIRFPGTGITVSCHVGSGNRTRVLFGRVIRALNLEAISTALRDGFEVKSTSSFCRGPEFCFPAFVVGALTTTSSSKSRGSVHLAEYTPCMGKCKWAHRGENTHKYRLNLSFFLMGNLVRTGGANLKSKHLEGRGKMIRGSRPVWAPWDREKSNLHKNNYFINLM